MTARLADYVEQVTSSRPMSDSKQPRCCGSAWIKTDDNQTEIDAAWDDVIDWRGPGVTDGTATLVDGPASLAQILAELAARRT